MSITIPKILQDFAKLRGKLLGTDRPDHLEELQGREEEIKTALLKLSAKKHDGIKLLEKAAQEELHDVYLKLLHQKADDPNHAHLLALRDVWVWFSSFFLDADAIIAENERFIKEQLAAPSDFE